MKIKSIFSVGVAVATLFGTAQAYMIADGTEVGGLDQFLDSGKTNKSKPEAEIAEFADLGLILNYDGTKSETVDIFEVIDEEDSSTQNYWAFELKSGPGYYVVKNANGDPNVMLFENLTSFDWGVVEWSRLETLGVGDELQISHVTEFNSASVAEPATFGLFALGITGLFAARRRSSKTK